MNIFEIYFEHILLIYVSDFLVFLAKINLDIVIWNQGCPEVRKIGGVNDFFKKNSYILVSFQRNFKNWRPKKNKIFQDWGNHPNPPPVGTPLFEIGTHSF